jgi:hypothetical protein
VGRLDDSRVCADVEGRGFVVPWAVVVVEGSFNDVRVAEAAPVGMSKGDFAMMEMCFDGG